MACRRTFDISVSTADVIEIMIMQYADIVNELAAFGFSGVPWDGKISVESGFQYWGFGFGAVVGDPPDYVVFSAQILPGSIFGPPQTQIVLSVSAAFWRRTAFFTDNGIRTPLPVPSFNGVTSYQNIQPAAHAVLGDFVLIPAPSSEWCLSFPKLTVGIY